MRERLVNQALYKPQLYAGIELLPLTFIGLVTGLVIMNSPTVLLRVIGGVFGVVLYFLMRVVNKKEPYQFSIVIRYVLFQKFYLNVAKFGSGSFLINNKG